MKNPLDRVTMHVKADALHDMINYHQPDNGQADGGLCERCGHDWPCRDIRDMAQAVGLQPRDLLLEAVGSERCRVCNNWTPGNYQP